MAEEEIQRGATKRQVARLIGNATVPIYVLGEDDRILFANDALAELLRADPDQLIGLDCSKSIPGDSSLATQWACSLALPPNSDRTLAQLHPVFLPGGDSLSVAARGWIRLAFPLEESTQPMVLCAIKPDRGDSDSLIGGVHRAKLQQVLARFSDDSVNPTDLWFLCGTNAVVLRTRKQLHAAIQSRLGVHVIGPAASSTLAAARWVALRRLNSSPANAASRAPCLVVECRWMDSERLRGTLEMIDDQSRLSGKLLGFPTVILHQLDELPQVLVDRLCSWASSSKASLMATSCTSDLIGLHPSHVRWGEWVATLDSHLVHVPALAQRIGDIEVLVAAWLELADRNRDRAEKYQWTREFMDAMLAYSWPGDIQEFDEVMRSALERCPGHLLTDQELSIAIRTFPSHMRRPEPLPKIELDRVLEQIERELIEKAMSHFPRNRTAAANHLGISRARFLRRLQQLGLESTDTSRQVESEEPVFEEWSEEDQARESDSKGP